MWIHEHADWPGFRWDAAGLSERLAAIRHRQGRLLGRMESLGFPLRAEADLTVLTEEILKSSEIEGEHLDRSQVRSSLARRLGLDTGGLVPSDRAVDGVVDLTLDATRRFSEPLDAERVFGWHSALFPTGRSGTRRITVGAWRTVAAGAMQVVSGPIGREHVHFEAPSADRLDRETRAFFEWFGDATIRVDPVLRTGVAHLWFVTVHPFEDGNGRIARAIADLALARSDGLAQRFYSMSTRIRAERADYYRHLERMQRGGLDVTPWLEWFLGCLDRAFGDAEITLGSVLRKARFFEAHADAPFNARQRTMVNRLLDGFHGKLTSSKWATIARCSQDTALRDIADLVRRGVLVRDAAGGRSTSYSLVAP